MTNVAILDPVQTDAQLDSQIQFPCAITPHALNPRAVLLTGATGLVASYLLDDLLRRTGADVYCLVRGQNGREAEERLLRHLRVCGLAQGDFGDRIRVIAGDLTEPRFGLSESDFLDLAARIDVIHHSAGWLNMAFPYSRLKPANVTGTLEILRFAGLVHTKPLHYLSSMVVFFSEAHTGDALLRESDQPRYHDSLKGGYSKSKWVADRLVAAAQERGLPGCIYRPVRIMGHSQTGAINDLNDVLPVLLKGCLLMGKFPRFDIEVTMVPVDYVTRSIMHLSGQAGAWGGAYHFFHPAPIPWGRLMGIMRDLGYLLEEVPYDQWWRDLKQAVRDSDGERKAFLSTLMLVLTAPHFLFFPRPPLDASLLHKALEGTGITCPPIDHALMATYVNHWRESGFIPLPEDIPAMNGVGSC